jgi:hypothetical protein
MPPPEGQSATTLPVIGDRKGDKLLFSHLPTHRLPHVSASWLASTSHAGAASTLHSHSQYLSSHSDVHAPSIESHEFLTGILQRPMIEARGTLYCRLRFSEQPAHGVNFTLGFSQDEPCV